MVDPVTGFATAKAAVDVLKSLIGLAKEVKSPEINAKVIELQALILDLQQQLVELHKRNSAVAVENRELKASEQFRQNLNFDDGMYWLTHDGKRDGPFCPTCLDADSKLVRLRWMEPTKRLACVVHGLVFGEIGKGTKPAGY